MTKYKNTILILISVILFAYAAFISIIPASVTRFINKDKLQADYFAASGLNVSFEKAYLRISPTFKTSIILIGLNIEFPDKQPVLHSQYTELNTTPAAVFGNTVDIKSLYLNHVKYDDLILPDGTNKLAFLPSVLNPKFIGKKGLTIIPGPVEIKGVDISYTTTEPYSYKTVSERAIEMTESEVRSFLLEQNFANIKIK